MKHVLIYSTAIWAYVPSNEMLNRIPEQEYEDHHRSGCGKVPLDTNIVGE